MNAKLHRIRVAGVRLAVLALGLALLLVPPTAAAQPPDHRQPVTLTVAGPADVPLGNLVRVVAVLRDGAGAPIVGAQIVFTSPAAFAGAVGEMIIGKVVTDAQGVATLDYQLRITGPNQFIARFYGDEVRQPAEAGTVIQATGKTQIIQRTAGLQVPLLGPWTLILVLGAVWVVYFLALLLVAGIPERPEAQPGAAPGGGR